MKKTNAVLSYDWPDVKTVLRINRDLFFSASDGMFGSKHRTRCSFLTDSKAVPDGALKIIDERCGPLWRTLSSGDLSAVESALRERAVTLSGGEKLWFHPSCTMPRNAGAERFSRAASASKADAVVVPKNFRNIKVWKDCSVYLGFSKDAYGNPDSLLWIISHPAGGNKDIVRPLIGETVRETLKRYESSIWPLNLTYGLNYDQINKASDAVCVHNGAAVFLDRTTEWLHDVSDGSFPHIVFEDELIAFLSQEAGLKIDITKFDSLYELMVSDDLGNISLALRTLSTLDWLSCPSVSTYLATINKRHWWNSVPKNKAVSYMLRSLGINAKSNTYSGYTVSRAELDAFRPLFEHIIRKEIQGRVDQIASRCSFKIRSDISFTIHTLSDE